MKLDHLSTYINALLFEHDCVIIPGFGGIVANPSGAQLNSIKNRFSPPFKELSFNVNLHKNDGLLANYISGAENRPFGEVLKTLEGIANELKNELKKGSKIQLNGIGTFYQDSTQKTQFEPSNETNFLLDSFGLIDFHSPSLPPSIKEKRNEPIKTIREPQVKDLPPIPPSRKRSLTKSLPYVLAAIPFVLYLIWLPIKTDLFTSNGNFNYSDLNPFTNKICATYSTRKLTYDVISEPPFNTSNPFADLTANTNYTTISFTELARRRVTVRLNETARESTYVDTSNTPKTNARFHIIGGCFRYLSNAEKLVGRMQIKGFNATIVDQNNGLYRVSISSFNTRLEAEKSLPNLQSIENPKAWLLVK